MVIYTVENTYHHLRPPSLALVTSDKDRAHNKAQSLVEFGINAKWERIDTNDSVMYINDIANKAYSRVKEWEV